METSTISGYRESYGGFDLSLQELERLEMQVCIAPFICGYHILEMMLITTVFFKLSTKP